MLDPSKVAQTSVDAVAVLSARARLTVEALRCGKKKQGREPYYGSSSHTEEPIECRRGENLFDAMVTRNHYGSLVLNASRALFIDVDVDSATSSDSGHRHNQRRDPWQAPWPRMFDDLQTVLASERTRGFRIYRTAAGFRILATTHQFVPGSRESNRLMNLVGADATFVDLCRIQNCFRARLTPKPWRCGSHRPPNKFPRASADERQQFNAWLAQYEHACHDRATCQFLVHVGPQDMHERVRPVIEFHDRETKAFEPLQLA